MYIFGMTSVWTDKCYNFARKIAKKLLLTARKSAVLLTRFKHVFSDLGALRAQKLQHHISPLVEFCNRQN